MTTMSNNPQKNTSSTRPGVGTRIRQASPFHLRVQNPDLQLTFERHRGVFETAHGIGENIRGRTLGAIDDMTHTGSPESKSLYSSIADRGRMEAETGMAHIHGYPDSNAANALHNERGHPPQTNAGIPGNGHTTGSGPGGSDHDRYGGGGGVDGGVGRRADGYGPDDQPASQNLEHQQPAIDGNTGAGPDPSGKSGPSPNRGPENVGSEAGWSSMSQDGALTPSQQRMKRDFPPELPSRPQVQVTDNDQTTQMHQ